MEVRARAQVRVFSDLGSEVGHAEVVAPDAALRRGGEERGFERGLAVHAERVDRAGGALAGDALEATDPFAAIAKSTDARNAVRTAKRRDEEVPCVCPVSGRREVEGTKSVDLQSV